MTDRASAPAGAEAGLTLEEVCRAAAVSVEWIDERVSAGLLVPRQAGFGAGAAAWRFDASALRRVRVMVRLEREFDAVPELAALVVDLEEEIARLRAQVARLGR